MSKLSPADAIKALGRVLQTEGLLIDRSFVAHDLANTRRAHTDDDNFAKAILAVMKELLAALKAPDTHGVACDHELTGWRRSKFPPFSGDEATLRIVFRAAKDGMELLAFGHRDYPDSVYFTAGQRID